MRVWVTSRDGSAAAAWRVDAPPGATLGDVLTALGAPAARGATLDGRWWRGATPFEATGCADGSTLVCGRGQAAVTAPPVASLAVRRGPDAGRRVGLASGTTVLGRGRAPTGDTAPCQVTLADPTVSRRHARVDVDHAGAIRVSDLGSVNGTWVTTGASPHAAVNADPVPLRPGDEIRIGTTVLSVDAAAGGHAVHPSRAEASWHRPPRAPVPPLPGPLTPPMAPAPGDAPHLGVAALVVPLVSGAVLALLYGPRFAVLAVLGPAVTLASWLAARAGGRRRVRHARREHSAALDRFRREVHEVRAAQAQARRAAHPDLVDLVAIAVQRGERLWERRRGDADFLHLEIGPGAVPLEVPLGAEPDAEARAVLDSFGPLVDAPVVIDAARLVGIVGPRHAAVSLARALALQVAALHGPADLRIAVLVSDAAVNDWDWAIWLPHAVDVHEPDAPLFGIGPTDAGRIVERAHAQARTAGDAVTWWVVDGHDAGVGHAGDVHALLTDRTAPMAGVVIGPTRADLPAACRTVLDVSAAGEVVHITSVDDARPRAGAVVGTSADTARQVALALAPLADPERAPGAGRLPRHVSLLSLLGVDDAESVSARWRATRRSGAAAVPVGAGERGVVELDLVRDGPHALIAGTTGSGKSELLRTFIAGLAATADTEHVTFVLVDYKGGAAFDRLAQLPHVVGVVTDLDDRLAARALRCLEAELRRREHVLRDAGRADVADFERARRDDPNLPALPRLVVVVDELATLVAEVPDFVDALVDVAQRGRSLGMHLVLATQRPAGVMKDAIRTNTNLRIALRVVDVSDSRDIIAAPDAAHLPPRAAGAAFARIGSGDLLHFQSALITTTSTSGEPRGVRAARWPRPADGPQHPAARDEPGASDNDATDLARLVCAIRTAHDIAGHAAPRAPWPDELAGTVTLDELDELRARDDRCAPRDAGTVAFAMADVPDQQAHRVLGWSPPSGNLMIAGLPGSGVTGAVATVAVSLARSATPAAVHLYVIAADVARLAPLADLPHCGGVIGVDDHERIARVLRVIDAALRTRRAGSHTAGQHPAIVLLVDGIGALRAELEQPVHIDQLDVLERVAADGPGLGVHIVLGAEHPGAVGHRLERTVTQRVLLRLPDRGDYLHAGLRAVDPSALPPGRGFDASTGHEVQIALAAHDGLAAAVARVADHLGELGCRRATVTRIGRLPSRITVSALAAGAHVAHGCIRVPIGTGDHDLCPIHLELRPGDHALIAGPARAGKTTALRTIAAQLRALDTVRVLSVASARTGIRPTRPELEELVASVLDDDMPAVVLVDDADLLDEFGLFTSLVLPGRPHLHVVATGRGDRLRGLFRHWTAELRRAQLGVLLRPDEVDGDLLGARLPRLSIAPRVAGRGYLIRDGEHELCQIAVATPDDAGEADDACDASDACDAGDRGDARCA